VNLSVRVRRQPSRESLNVPARSRLYGIEPREAGTLWAESLTSYTNRLGWVHQVPPKVLVAQELVPYLGREYLHGSGNLGACCRGGWFMHVNGNGSLARDWLSILERLTTRSDLYTLTSHLWMGNLSSRGHLRAIPAWCPVCYAEWKEQGVPIYQPLLWMFRTVTICTKHTVALENHCPHCQKYQSVISCRSQPGYCTQCNIWLGRTLGEEAIDEVVEWQQWVMCAFREIFLATVNSESIAWENFFTNLATIAQERGMAAKLARLAGLERTRLYQWASCPSTRYTPSLDGILAFCHACGVTPLQIMRDPITLVNRISQGVASSRTSQSHSRPPKIDRERCLEFIRAVLDGREEPLGFTQVAKRLGYSTGALRRNFPQECSLMTEHAREYRRQRKQQRESSVCEEVRQAVITLHSQEIFPSQSQVQRLLSKQNLMTMPIARKVFHDTRRELGVESRGKKEKEVGNHSNGCQQV
jgi:DNA-binding phage protein